jgi:hypothetical protein
VDLDFYGRFWSVLSFWLWFGVVVTVGVEFHGLSVAFLGWHRSVGGYGSSGLAGFGVEMG